MPTYRLEKSKFTLLVTHASLCLLLLLLLLLLLPNTRDYTNE